jgi:hypothetical protein
MGCVFLRVLWEAVAGGAFLCVFVEEAGEPLAAATKSAASTRKRIVIRPMQKVCGEFRAFPV